MTAGFVGAFALAPELVTEPAAFVVTGRFVPTDGFASGAGGAALAAAEGSGAATTGSGAAAAAGFGPCASEESKGVPAGAPGAGSLGEAGALGKSAASPGEDAVAFRSLKSISIPISSTPRPKPSTIKASWRWPADRAARPTTGEPFGGVTEDAIPVARASCPVSRAPAPG